MLMHGARAPQQLGMRSILSKSEMQGSLGVHLANYLSDAANVRRISDLFGTKHK
jgi:hypothetical protein